jgi:hypothetical protein
MSIPVTCIHLVDWYVVEKLEKVVLLDEGKGLFSTNVHSKYGTFGHHKIVCGARSYAFCKCVVIVSFSCPEGVDIFVLHCI